MLLVRTAFPFTQENVLFLSFENIVCHCYADDTQHNLSFPSGSEQCEAFICGCRVDVPECKPAHHLKLSLDEAVSTLCKIFPSWLTTLQWPLLPVNNFTVIPDNQLSCIKQLPSQLQLTPSQFLLLISRLRASLGTQLNSPPSSLSRPLPRSSLEVSHHGQYFSGCSSSSICDWKKIKPHRCNKFPLTCYLWKVELLLLRGYFINCRHLIAWLPPLWETIA